MHLLSPHVSRLTLSTLLIVAACSDDIIEASDDDTSADTETSGDGDPGDGDGDPGDGDGDPGDGDGDPGDGDGDPGDGDGDPGDGDGDPQPAECGDGVVDAGEECDDGNDVDTDDCLSTCVAASCGDSVIWEGNETCDDGVNDGSYDGCAPGCQALGPYCGDGLVDANNEGCDDQNQDADDGCTTCVIDDLSCCEGEPSVCAAVTELSGSLQMLNHAIPDNLYNGAADSMICEDIDLGPADSCGAMVVEDVSVELGIDHSYIGDLTIKLGSPDATVATLMSRPGADELADDGADEPYGDNSNLSAMAPVLFIEGGATDAELMGATIDGQTVCVSDMECEFDPNPGAGPGMAFEDYIGETALGQWRLCVGDSAPDDTGSLESYAITVTVAAP